METTQKVPVQGIICTLSSDDWKVAKYIEYVTLLLSDSFQLPVAPPTSVTFFYGKDMTIYEKIKDNPEEKLSLLSDKELLQLLLEITHNKAPKKLADKILKEDMTFANIFATLDNLLKENLINDNFYDIMKII